MIWLKKITGKNNRRAKRIDCDLPIKISICDDLNGPTIAGPVPARMINFSVYGICFNIEKICIDNYHLFYSPTANSSHIIYIKVELSNKKRSIIPAWPVWFDLINSSDKDSFFQMGVEFMLPHNNVNIKNIRDLIYSKSKSHTSKQSWFKKLLSKLVH